MQPEFVTSISEGDSRSAFEVVLLSVGEGGGEGIWVQRSLINSLYWTSGFIKAVASDSGAVSEEIKSSYERDTTV